ncbi:MAG: DbpA RNA binding domain-containing protein, partial [Myxococcales bacterium]|nr:DbpA RNA binding domain-containing protein [Myxococcales bacterium]
AARGIDVPDIELVVHLDLPTDPESYTHRSGRTGRAGQKGRSLALVPVRAERHARAIFARAKVKVRFAAPPTIDEVRAAVEAEARRQLDAQLAGDAPAPRFAEEARRLLAAHDAETLVARLLAASAPRLPTRPRQVNSALTPPRATRPRPQHGEAGAAVRFYVTWGRRRGASPKRVVALLCRRGGIAGGDIGHIDVGTQATVVEIDARVAADFASRAAAPDPRDPHVRIERFREQRADERHQRTSQPRASARRGLGSFEPHRPPTRGPAPGGAARHRPRDH